MLKHLEQCLVEAPCGVALGGGQELVREAEAVEIVAGCAGIAGTATIGAHCTIGGRAGILGHLTIVDHVHISATSLVTRSILKPGHYTGIFPIDDNAAWEKNAAALKQLHKLRERIKALEKKTDS